MGHFRRYLFLALTAMLATVLVYLMIRSRKSETRLSSPRTIEIVRESHPTATRAIVPEELQAGGCTIRAGAVEVRLSNSGRSSYRNVLLKISFEGKGAPVQRNRLVADTVAPGASVTASIPLQDLPAGVKRCVARVLYADVMAK